MPLLGGKQFKQGWFTGTSDVKFDLGYTVMVTAKLNTDGTIGAGSFIDFDLSGALSGKLLDLDIDENRAIGALFGLLRKNPGNAILTTLLDLAKLFGLIPDFKIQAEVAGLLQLKGRAELLSGTSAQKLTFGGSIDLGLTANVVMEFAGSTYTLFGLPDLINQQLKIKQTF